MKIGVDLDEVVYNFLAVFRRFLIENGYATDLPKHSWIGEKELGVNKETVDELIEDAIIAGVFLNGDPIDGAITGLRTLRDKGHSIHLATHREHYKNRRRAVSDTVAWLDLHDVPWDTLTFAKDKTIVDVDVLVEDNSDNYFAMVAAGRPAIIFDQEWNRGFVGNRAYWWGDVIQIIKELDNA